MRRLFAVVSLIAVGWACAPAPLTSGDKAHAIEAQVWSPYCPGRLLIDCTTSQARGLRVQIQQRVDRGDSAEEILRWARKEFGPEAIARPDASGRGLAIWLIPIALIAAGAVLLAGIVRRWSRRSSEEGSVAPSRSASEKAKPGIDWTQRVRDEVRRTL